MSAACMTIVDPTSELICDALWACREDSRPVPSTERRDLLFGRDIANGNLYARSVRP